MFSVSIIKSEIKMDIDDPPVIYGLETQARALCSVPALDDSQQFIIGTQGLRVEHNQLHLLTFDADTNSVSKRIFDHGRDEIWSVSVAPHNPNLCATVFNRVTMDSGTNPSVAKRWCLWKLPEEEDNQTPRHRNSSEDALTSSSLSSVESLQSIGSIELEQQGEPRCLAFHPERAEAVLVSDGGLYQLGLGSGAVRLLAHLPAKDGRSQLRYWHAAWNPHHSAQQVIAACDSGGLRGFDVRCPPSDGPVVVIDNAHNGQARCVDYNPNKQYYLASSGDDGAIRFWDTRQPSNPVKMLRLHKHWACCVQFNPYHDQLVLSGGTDAKVYLTNNRSISSEPVLSLDDDLDDDDDDDDRRQQQPELDEDRTVSVVEEHEDSVYAAVWCATDPWLFASLSYDGRLVISHVPKSEKYRILL
uniref:WD_REPEATS_REGION domain-containing protein n=2 Tax=Macrostomum lignano TaxID=282301 RepID=A0A1I8H6G9_9PLAT